MLKRVLVVVVFIAVFIGGWVLYNRNARNAMGSGDVVSTDSSKSSSDSTNTDLDGRPVAPTPSRSDAPGTINGEPAAGTTSNQPPPAQKAPIAQSDTPTVTQVIAPAVASARSAISPTTAPPTSDTIAPDPPNGLAFGGTGRFQWYRQGNITWRVNTSSGSTCIAFATMEEWQKPIVYSHGCGNG